MECECEQRNAEDAGSGWWMYDNRTHMTAFTVVGYLLYRFSQTLPALIRWPIRLFCTLTGLSTLWSWVSHLVGTLRGIQSVCKWLSRVWKFIQTSSSKYKWLVAVITGSSGDVALDLDGTRSVNKPSLRLILLGPPGGGRTALANTLLGSSETPSGAHRESTKRWAVVGGREVVVVDTPDLLGPSLGSETRAREAMRSLQLASPGPDAFLLVMRTPGTPGAPGGAHLDPDPVQATLRLFGDEAAHYIIPVLTHADQSGHRDQQTLDQILDQDRGGLRGSLAVCDQWPELVGNGPDCPPEGQKATRTRLLGRVTKMKTTKGHFVHELQRREDVLREELLQEVSSELARKLGRF